MQLSPPSPYALPPAATTISKNIFVCGAVSFQKAKCHIKTKSHLSLIVTKFNEEECLILWMGKYKQEEISLNYRHLPVVPFASPRTR
jgi:hypothetical protein